jgi:hypothetical protein
MQQFSVRVANLRLNARGILQHVRSTFRYCSSMLCDCCRCVSIAAFLRDQRVIAAAWASADARQKRTRPMQRQQQLRIPLLSFLSAVLSHYFPAAFPRCIPRPSRRSSLLDPGFHFVSIPLAAAFSFEAGSALQRRENKAEKRKLREPRRKAERAAAAALFGIAALRSVLIAAYLLPSPRAMNSARPQRSEERRDTHAVEAASRREIQRLRA